MRSNLTNKFRDYLQELPNEQTTFLEALRKVQDIEEKLEKDGALMAQDASARKRLGWLKLKGKGGGQEKETTEQTANEKETGPAEGEPNETQLSEVVTSNGVVPETAIADTNHASSLVNEAKPSVDKPPEPVLENTENGSDARALKQLRRRKQKPNLSRTKRTRDRSEQLDQTDPPIEPDKIPVERQDESLAVQMSPSLPGLVSDTKVLEKKPESKHHKHKSSRRKEVSPNEVNLDRTDQVELEPFTKAKIHTLESRKHPKRLLKPR